MTNSADPDQLASSEANWSGSILFVKAAHMPEQGWLLSEASWSGSTLFAKTGHVVFSKRRVNSRILLYIFMDKIVLDLSSNTPP